MGNGKRIVLVGLGIVALVLGLRLALAGIGSTERGADRRPAPSGTAIDGENTVEPELTPSAATGLAERERPRSEAPTDEVLTFEWQVAAESGEEDEPEVAPSKWTLVGRVLWPDGTPAVARVFSDEAWGMGRDSAKDGSFELPGLEGDAVRILAMAKPIDPWLASRTPRPGRTREGPDWFAESEVPRRESGEVLLTLTSGLELIGRVTDESGVGLERFRIHAIHARWRASGSREAGTLKLAPWRSATPESMYFTDTAGSFVYEGLTPGVWDLWASAVGYADSPPQRVEVPGSEPLVFALTRPATVRGIVLDPRGVPVAEAWISIPPESRTSLQPERLATAGARGAFSVTLPPGRVRIMASSVDSAASEPLELELLPGQVLEGQVLSLREGGRIEGQLPDDDVPEPSRVFLVETGVVGSTPFRSITETDLGGRFTFAGVPEGSFEITAFRDGVMFGQNLRLAVGETVHVDLESRPSSARGTLAGRVLHRDGTVAVGVDVQEVPWGRVSRTDSAGRFRLPDLAPGQVGVRVTRRKTESSGLWTVTIEPGQTTEIELVID